MSAYDSRPDTLKHSARVGLLMQDLILELISRAFQHDVSKLEPPEVGMFDEYTPKLKTLTYGSQEYKDCLTAMSDGLAHHYAANRHHPEHFPGGIRDMTLVDVIEMLADWKAATERHPDGSIMRSLEIQQERFGLSDELMAILHSTVRHFGWHKAAPGDRIG